ncbi:MAG TPA: sigma-54 dependent transcriptional regulator [bacterium]|nr:sigma-54 dependent transcriptional regulator [bacterium]
MTSRILVIDDKENIRKLLSSNLESHGYVVDAAEDGETGVGMFKDVIYNIVITDVKMPGMSGLDVLEAVKEINPDTVVIVMTAFADMDDAIHALKRGASDYIRKPFKLEEIRAAVEKAISTQGIIAENRLLRREVEDKYKFDAIIAKSKQMEQVFESIKRVSAANSTVLITGETGTGKELVARAIHFNSPRRAKPFTAVNCAAIPTTLLESELFGHVKGAFTDAWSDKYGRFEESEGGTLFLDEISEINPAIQAKLLRVLQDGEFSRVGENKVRKSNVRVITATNTDLHRAVEEERFRKDLYFRINVLPINIPPLRERREDIPLLLRHFLDISCKDNNLSLRHFSPEAMNALLNYSWPGNVRELQNLVERCSLMCAESEIKKEELPAELLAAETNNPGGNAEMIFSPDSDDNVSLKQTMSRITETIEKEMIIKALKKADGNKELAAQLLEISRRSLFYKLKQYDIG